MAHVARDAQLLVRLLDSAVHQSQFSTGRSVELMASWTMCVLRYADKSLVEEWVRLSEACRYRLATAKDLDSLLFHLFEPVLKHLDLRQVLLVGFLKRLHALVLREVPSRKRQLTLAAPHLNPLTLFSPVQCDVLLTFERRCTRWAKNASRLQFAGFTVISVVFLYVFVLEATTALVALELCILEHSHHDPIHVLEAIPLFAVRTHVLVQNHSVLLVPAV